MTPLGDGYVYDRSQGDDGLVLMLLLLPNEVICGH